MDGVTVIINEVAPANYMRGRQSRTPGAPQPSPREIVERYLAAMEARDLDLARSFLADGFTMTFPGGATFTSPEQLVEWARPRYRSIAKTYENFDEASSTGDSIVYCYGTLHGEWPDGQPFSGIRFIDRFTVRDGRLTTQQVWNDLAEVRGR